MKLLLTFIFGLVVGFVLASIIPPGAPGDDPRMRP